MLNPGGAIAMQIPQFDIMPVSRIIDNVAALPDFIGFFENFETGMHYYPTGYYYETLSNLTANLEIWITGYLHQMQNHTAIIEWLSSTGLKPYIERLPKEFQPYFLSKVLDGIKNQYPAQKNGRVLFEFKRLFFIAYKP
jgi:trans-aconitate 2-methyltransferase